MSDNQREVMLEALKSALEQIKGVRFVDRQAITPKMVSDRQMPAIIIDEDSTSYAWAERHGSRTMTAIDTIGLDCQVMCRRGDYEGDPSTVRQAFAWQVMNQLANHSTLDGVCKDAALRFNVQYPPSDYPYARAIVALSVEYHEAFDGRAQTEWQQLILSTTEPVPGHVANLDLTDL